MTQTSTVQEVLAAKTAEHEARMARYNALLRTADQFRATHR